MSNNKPLNVSASRAQLLAVLAKCVNLAELRQAQIDFPDITSTMMFDRLNEIEKEQRLRHQLELQAAREQAASRTTNKITFKVSSEKKCLSVYGIQRRPVTLYAGQWLRLLTPDIVKAMLAFIETHRSELAWKEGADTADE